jgi:hypothetical protein
LLLIKFIKFQVTTLSPNLLTFKSHTSICSFQNYSVSFHSPTDYLSSCH